MTDKAKIAAQVKQFFPEAVSFDGFCYSVAGQSTDFDTYEDAAMAWYGANTEAFNAAVKAHDDSKHHKRETVAA